MSKYLPHQDSIKNESYGIGNSVVILSIFNLYFHHHIVMRYMICFEK